MDFGKKINELRKSKNVTQDEMAAELGVTAAAVSKWENNYTLPDIMMLCALADYFGVTTDELLGRNQPQKHAVIAAQTDELGLKIASIAKTHGIIIHGIYRSFQEALSATTVDSKIGYILVSFEAPTPEEVYRCAPDRIHVIESQSSSDDEILKGFELVLSHLA